MREQERDALVLVLAIAAGAVDAWSYFGVAHVFVANMTGNTVFLGMALAGQKSGEIIKPALAIAFYAMGALIGASLAGEPQEGRPWPRRISFVLAGEGVLLALTAVLWERWYPLHGTLLPWILLAIAAFATGMQSAAMQTLKIPGIATTYITGTWTTLMHGLSRLSKRKAPQDSEKKEWPERLWMQAGVIFVYCMAAALIGWILHVTPKAASAIPAGAVLFVACYGLVRGEGGTTSIRRAPID